MILETCPYCHRPFEAEAIVRDEVDASDLTRKDINPKWAAPHLLSRGRLGRGGPPDPEAVLTYKVTYKCKHCGKEWSKIETKDEKLPEEYSETGFD